MRQKILFLIALIGASILVFPGSSFAQFTGSGGAGGGGTPPMVDHSQEEGAGPSKAMGKSSKQPIRFDRSVEKKIDRMPGDQLIQVRGKEMTVAAFRKKNDEEARRVKEQIQSFKSKSGPDPGLRGARPDDKQAAQIAASNAKVRAEVARLLRARANPGAASARMQAIREEAKALEAKRKGGGLTPAESQRALELYGEYEQLR